MIKSIYLKIYLSIKIKYDHTYIIYQKTYDHKYIFINIIMIIFKDIFINKN